MMVICRACGKCVTPDKTECLCTHKRGAATCPDAGFKSEDLPETPCVIPVRHDNYATFIEHVLGPIYRCGGNVEIWDQTV